MTSLAALSGVALEVKLFTEETKLQIALRWSPCGTRLGAL
jgi:hypothetical protein